MGIWASAVKMSIIMMVNIDSVQSYNICQGHFSELFFPLAVSSSFLIDAATTGMMVMMNTILMVVVISIMSNYTASAKITLVDSFCLSMPARLFLSTRP